MNLLRLKTEFRYEIILKEKDQPFKKSLIPQFCMVSIEFQNLTNEKLMITITEISEYYCLGKLDIQKKFQRLLINALSHERITPLNSIINVSDLLLSDVKNIAQEFPLLADTLIQKVQIVRSSATILLNMTYSQLHQLAINYKTYKFKATEPASKSFS